MNYKDYDEELIRSTGSSTPGGLDGLDLLDPPITTSAANTAATSATTASSSTSSGPKKRVRTGCLNCRRKHKKCDESKPICSSCISRGESCEWPIVQKPRLFNEYSLYEFDPQSPQQTQKRPRIDPFSFAQSPGAASLSGAVGPSVTAGNSPLPLQRHSIASLPYIPTGVNIPQSYRNINNNNNNPPIVPGNRRTFDEYQLVYDSLEALLIRFLVDAEPITNIPQPRLSSFSLNSYEEITTMKHYLHTVAPQLEWATIDSTVFKTEIPHLSRLSNVLRNAIYATSLIHQANDSFNPTSMSMGKILSLFEKSLLELVRDSQQANVTIRVTSAFFLFEFCINCQASEPSKWRVLLNALLSYIQREGVHPRDKNPINNNIYWIAILFDINCTKIFEESTIVAHDLDNLEGLDPVGRFLSYVSMTFNLLELNRPQVDFDSKWEKIWIDMNSYTDQKIADERYVRMGPLMDRADQVSPFPMVLQSSSASVLCQQLYLILKIVLIQDRPRKFITKHMDSHQAPWYAKRLCSISMWNKEYANWLTTPLSLNIAGKVLTHEDEHQAIIGMIDEIKANSGYVLKYGKQELLEFWGS